MKIRLPYRRPLDWDVLVGFFGARAIPGVERVEGPEYRRTVRIGGATGRIAVRPCERGHALEAESSGLPARTRSEVERRLRHLFDLDADPGAIRRAIGRDRSLGTRLAKLPGIRVPGAWDGFELAVRAILGQQVSVAGARTLAGRLVARCGEPLPGAPIDAGDTARLFPSPSTLADADLSGLGLTGARIHAITTLARAVADGRLAFADTPSPDRLDTLRALPGIGEWTAQYVAMRALGDRDAFPASDLGVRRALARRGVLPPVRDVERRSEAWRPFRAYAVMLLWLG